MLWCVADTDRPEENISLGFNQATVWCIPFAFVVLFSELNFVTLINNLDIPWLKSSQQKKKKKPQGKVIVFLNHSLLTRNSRHLWECKMLKVPTNVKLVYTNWNVDNFWNNQILWAYAFTLLTPRSQVLFSLKVHLQ